MIILSPQGLARKTMKDILGYDYSRDDIGEIKIGNYKYSPIVMEEDYDECLQIKAREGDLVFYNLITYGYGETISWEDLEKAKNDLGKWGEKMCKKYNCNMKIEVSANYW